MKIISIKKKSLAKATMGLIFVLIVGVFSTSFGMQHYYKLDFSTGLVLATELNVRSGPNTKYPIVTKVKKNEYIRVLAGIGDWYVVQTDADYIGAVSKKYIKAIYASGSGNAGGSTSGGSMHG